MLEDRDYMKPPDFRGPSFRGRHFSWTVLFLGAYTLVFLAELICQRFFPANPFFQGHNLLTRQGLEIIPSYLQLSVEGLGRGYLWQLVTYQFMHAGFLHLFFNGWAIYTFGRELENLLGGPKFVSLMLSSGMVGGVFQVLVALAWPQYFGGPVVGASACAFGLVAAYAMIFPERELTLLIFFVIPLQLRAKTLLIGLAVIALVGIAFPMGNVANAAHLGGMGMGCFFVRYLLNRDWALFKPAPAPRITIRKPGSVAPAKRVAESGPALLESDVDAILDKISAKGIRSLTAQERATLEAARKKMVER